MAHLLASKELFLDAKSAKEFSIEHLLPLVNLEGLSLRGFEVQQIEKLLDFSKLRHLQLNNLESMSDKRSFKRADLKTFEAARKKAQW